MNVVRMRAIFPELETIRNGGNLTAESVLEWAEAHRNSKLHGLFTWDDTEAARRWRLEEARSIVMSVECVYPNVKGKSRVYVSLSTDRTKGRGFSIMQEVMDDASRREVLLTDAMNELESVRKRFRFLKELAAVWSSIRKATKRRVGR